MAATSTVNPKVAPLLPNLRTRTTEQLIGDHAVACQQEAATADIDDLAAWLLVISGIECVLEERGVPICIECGTPSGEHADFCPHYDAKA